jgi:hypothetical protein
MSKYFLTAALVAISLLSSCDDSKSKPQVKSAPISKTPKKTITTSTLPSDIVMAQYIQLKNAFVMDAVSKVTEQLQSFDLMVNSQLAVEGSELQKQTLLNGIAELIKAMRSQAFEEQRETFIKLTEVLIQWNEAYPGQEKLYMQYCPMYKGGNYWLSMEEQVLNPYYGSKMLRCGVVEKTLN